MSANTFVSLATITAAKPVFMIVMGVFLLVIAWRLAKESEGWAARLMIAGALLLAFGYSVLMPLYEAGKIPSQGSPVELAATAIAWNSVKLMAMNGGWLLFGIGLSLHAKVFRTLNTANPSPAPSPDAHESVA